MKTLTFRLGGLLLIAAALASSFMVADPAHAICTCFAGPLITSPVMTGTGATCTLAAADLSNQLTAYANNICGGDRMWCNRSNITTHACGFDGDTKSGYTTFNCKDNC